MDQHPAPLDMAEEAVADASAFRRALDQAGNVGEHEFAALVMDNAKLRVQRRERIVAHLGMRVGEFVDKGRLSGIGQADKADVGEQLETQPDPHLLARLAGLMLARGTIGRRLVAGVAAPPQPAFQQRDPLPRLDEVGKD